MSKILIFLGHPSCDRHSFCETLAEGYEKGAKVSGHEVEIIKIAKLKFDPILHEGLMGDQPIEHCLTNIQRKIMASDHLVFIYPLWQFMLPALLKGFLERTFSPEFAYTRTANSPFESGLLTGKTACILQTMGMPNFAYRWWFKAHSANAFRDMLKFCGVKPVNIRFFGMIEKSQKREVYKTQVYELGRAAL